jgi:hypothetical protein
LLRAKTWLEWRVVPHFLEDFSKSNPKFQGTNHFYPYLPPTTLQPITYKMIGLAFAHILVCSEQNYNERWQHYEKTSTFFIVGPFFDKETHCRHFWLVIFIAFLCDYLLSSCIHVFIVLCPFITNLICSIGVDVISQTVALPSISEVKSFELKKFELKKFELKKFELKFVIKCMSILIKSNYMARCYLISK